MVWKHLVAFVLLLVSFTVSALPAKPLSIAEHNKLVPSRICLDNATNYHKSGIISFDQMNAATAKCVADAKAVLGRDISVLDLTQQVKTSEERTTAEKFGGFFDGIDWVRTLFAIGIVIFGCIFVGMTLPLWMSLPPAAYAFALFGISIALSWYGLSKSSDNAIWGLMSALVWIGAQVYTTQVVLKLKGNPSGFFLIATAVTGLIAFLFQSSLVGYVPVICLLCAAGFAAEAFGLGFAIGFSDDKSVSIGTTVAFILLGTYVLIRISGHDDPYIQPFAPASYLVGSFVGFLGLLILSSKWYAGPFTGGYLFSNVILMPLFGFGAVMIGSMYGIPELQKVGGTFFALWLIEKYVEWTFKGLVSVSVFGLLGSIGGFYLFTALREHAEKLGPYLFFVS